MHLVQQVLNSDNFDQDIYTGGIGDDIDDDLKIIDVDDLIEETAV